MGEGNSPIQAKGVNCLLSRELSKDSYDHYSPALIPFYFYFTSFTRFPTKYRGETMLQLLIPFCSC